VQATVFRRQVRLPGAIMCCGARPHRSGVSHVIQSRNKLGGLNRMTALLLAVVWLSVGFVSIALGFLQGYWLAIVCGLFAIVYGVLWLRVVARSQLLSWQELVAPWRGATHQSRPGPTSRSKRP